MQSRVTAIVVATNGAARLERTLAGIAQQTRQPDRLILIDNGSTDTTAAIMADVPAERIIATGEVLPFGAAIKLALKVVGDDATSDEWLWLLTHDSEPEPDALEIILATVQRAPSVAVAGPKLTSWDRPDHIREIGQTLTRLGARWQLSTEELDQEQRDTQQDTLGVGPVGMLVQRELWAQLGGFDRALTTYDDGLDLCVRARLAGYRVVVSPESRVRFAGDGVAGPEVSRKKSVARANHRRSRRAQLHRRLAYAPAWAVPLHWLTLLPLAILRTIWYLIRELPGRIPGEFAATFAVMFSGRKVRDARRSIARTRTMGWDSIRPLRVDYKTVRTQQMIDKEAILARQGRVKHEAHFISTGGLSVVTVAIVLSAALFYSLFTAQALTGGGLLPLSTTLSDLWANTHYGHHGTGSLLEGPAHPFNFVLAILGSITFWQPSYSLVLLFLLAIPLSALGAWFFAARLTERPVARGFVAVAWMLSPTLLASLNDGRVPSVIVHILLPWLLIALMSARKSWSSAATSSLLLAAILACAPSLIPAAALLLLVGLAFSGRGVVRVLTVAVASAALYAPLLGYALANGNPLMVLIDPGVPQPFTPATANQLLLGFPTAGMAGWNDALATLGIGDWPYTIIVACLVAPLGLLALAGVVFSKAKRTAVYLLLAGLGLASALVANQFVLSSVGVTPVGIWAGPSLSIYWMGLLGLAVATITVLPKLSETVSVLAGLALLVAVAPIIVSIFMGHPSWKSQDYNVPAVVRAAAVSGQDVGTLFLVPQEGGAVLGETVRGTGATLDEQTTLTFTHPELSSSEEELAELIGALASEGSSSQSAQLNDLGINFVVLEPASSASGRANDPAVSSTLSRIQSALDNNADVVAVGPTEFGDLWKVVDANQSTSAPTLPPLTKALSQTIWIVQIAVLLGLFLLALPTGAVVEKPPRKKRRGKDQPAAASPKGKRRSQKRDLPVVEGSAVAAVAPTSEAEDSSPQELTSPEQVDDAALPTPEVTSGEDISPALVGDDEDTVIEPRDTIADDDNAAPFDNTLDEESYFEEATLGAEPVAPEDEQDPQHNG
ncbi:glycosyltransferase family 2 protein [Lysinibacter cavernae]|uniref:GT2 family glycosyltransferase n=1 Tax=Lysinibacter cavernae TaxID=1640652 RepID=A0A7X5R3P7_9MICO|nr:glycosyltransferase family 2 protein [Lysinibacter cavernae]NIH55084.1 GT2 family glycosyltransferase [Lysinibacter cavernae]